MKTGNLYRCRALAYRLGAWSGIVLLLYSLATILIVTLIGGPPVSVDETFKALHANRITGLLRLDILTVFVMPLYFVLFYSLYLALREVNRTIVTISTLFVFIGVTLFLASPSVFSYLQLSDAYFSATTEAEKSRLWAAAEAVFVTDIWHGTGTRIGGLLVQLGATVLSFVMLKSAGFNRFTGYTGILTHGLDLVHVVAGFFLAGLATTLMGIAGVLYLVWFPLVIVALFRLAKKEAANEGY